MATTWTPERKAKQSQAIRQWQPWLKSTGAKTAEGKAAWWHAMLLKVVTGRIYGNWHGN